jgi:hypothetical protein
MLFDYSPFLVPQPGSIPISKLLLLVAQFKTHHWWLDTWLDLEQRHQPKSRSRSTEPISNYQNSALNIEYGSLTAIGTRFSDPFTSVSLWWFERKITHAGIYWLSRMWAIDEVDVTSLLSSFQKALPGAWMRFEGESTLRSAPPAWLWVRENGWYKLPHRSLVTPVLWSLASSSQVKSSN